MIFLYIVGPKVAEKKFLLVPSISFWAGIIIMTANMIRIKIIYKRKDRRDRFGIPPN